ncbi:MAG: hypothetical protein ACFFA0_00370 [Promethearchaeota archaeon]
MKKKGVLLIVIVLGAVIIIGFFFILPLFDENTNRYSHTINIDGVNDFNINENFTTSALNYYGYIAWDQDFIYFGMQGVDIDSSSSNFWVLIYIGNGGTGTTNGITYNNQDPILPFSATHHVRWRADNSYTNAMEWTGSWTDASWDFTGDVYQSGQFLEIRIPIADLGSPSEVSVHMSIVNEPGDWTYAGVPSTSFSNGNDPDYTQYFHFDLDGTEVPTDYNPL